ncbi:hypothetical protein KUTeg_017803 [Tegillarca granosa]|uniref:Long-chain-fatty-acid--CoA ligase n=1 Tax=Tegillarca granosa TaxID=220873 RepID=A0ABQ9EG85_TEGGR|nr:hypothetical protein KUTeg_017803 [Tegillarca granosa]
MSANNKYLYGLAAGGLGIATWRTLFPWLTKDEFNFMRGLVKTAIAIGPSIRRRLLLIDKFEEQAAKTPHKAFVIFEDKIYSYEFVNEMANRVASLASTWNLKTGDTVAIMISNEPAFIWTFLGLQKIGLVSTLINFHMTSGPLAHCLNSSGSKVLILGNVPSNSLYKDIKDK